MTQADTHMQAVRTHKPCSARCSTAWCFSHMHSMPVEGQGQPAASSHTTCAVRAAASSSHLILAETHVIDKISLITSNWPPCRRDVQPGLAAPAVAARRIAFCDARQHKARPRHQGTMATNAHPCKASAQRRRPGSWHTWPSTTRIYRRSRVWLWLLVRNA